MNFNIFIYSFWFYAEEKRLTKLLQKLGYALLCCFSEKLKLLSNFIMILTVRPFLDILLNINVTTFYKNAKHITVLIDLGLREIPSSCLQNPIKISLKVNFKSQRTCKFTTEDN